MYCYSFRKNIVTVLELNFDFTEVIFFRKYVMISLQKKKKKTPISCYPIDNKC